MISSGLNLVMTVIGFAVSTMFIVFICTRLVCARIQLNATRRSFPIATRSDLSILERGLNGLEPVVYANFPTKKYSDSFFTSTEDTQCTVCLAEYQSEDLLRILPYCGHFFHVTCIDIWLRQHSTCPVCRISLRELSDRKRGMQPLYSSAVRSQLSSESYETRSHHCLLNGHGFPSSTHVNPGMESNQGDHFVSEGDTAEAVDIVSPIAEDNQIMKDSRTKQVESPSNT